MIEQKKCAGSEEIVRERITKLEQQWEQLVTKSSKKTQHLKEANQKQQFNNNIKDLDFWLGEVRKFVLRILTRSSRVKQTVDQLTKLLN